MTFVLHSEPRPPTGGMVADGALNVLGRPAMDFWALYVREVVQNSWDARVHDTPLRVRLETRELTEDQLAVLRSEVLADLPPGSAEDHWEQLHEARRVVTVTDVGSHGMGGPARADTTAGQQDFADFVWNIGQPPDKEFGGGTYGYGKSVHYRASATRTIVLHTRFAADDGTVESRLIVCAWGHHFEHDSGGRRTPFTGRHWWGVPSDEPEVPIAPLTGSEADRLAARLGMPAIDGTGTSVMALAAAVDDPVEWGRTVAGSVLWHCWPRLVQIGSDPTMDVEIVVDGDPLPSADPRRHPEIGLLVECLEEVAQGGPAHSAPGRRLAPVEVRRPAITTGRVSLRLLVSPAATDDEPGRPFEGPLRHVALMRQPRLVVCYLEGPPAPAPLGGWGGVFLADAHSDRMFAQSEPPAHDAWIPAAIENRTTRSVVNVSLRHIAEIARDFALPRPRRQDGDGSGMAALADRLGSLLPVAGPAPVSATPSSNPGRPDGGGPRPRSSRISVGAHRMEAHADGVLLVAELAVQVGQGVSTLRVRMEVDVATSDSGAVEREAPAGAPRPRLVGWRSARGDVVAETELRLSADSAEGWSACVLVPRDTAVVLRPSCLEASDA